MYPFVSVFYRLFTRRTHFKILKMTEKNLLSIKLEEDQSDFLLRVEPVSDSLRLAVGNFATRSANYLGLL